MLRGTPRLLSESADNGLIAFQVREVLIEIVSHGAQRHQLGLDAFVLYVARTTSCRSLFASKGRLAADPELTETPNTRTAVAEAVVLINHAKKTESSTDRDTGERSWRDTVVIDHLGETVRVAAAA